MPLLNPSPLTQVLRTRRDLLRYQLLLAGVLLSFALKSTAQSMPSREYQVKAVFLFNFAQFVEWPTNAFAGNQAPLVIGILGTDPFGSFLDETVRGETVNSHPLVIQRYHRVDEIKDCHILFVSDSEAGQLEQIFQSLKDRNILTVGDVEGFAQRGGIVRFVTDKKIRLRINLAAAKAADLTISSKLLRPAEIVDPGKD